MSLPTTSQLSVGVPRGAALRVFHLGRISGLVYSVSGQVVNAVGQYTQFSRQITVGVAGAIENTAISVPEGEIVGFSVAQGTAGTKRGDLFVRAVVVAGSQLAAPELSLLAQGYVTEFGGPGFPGLASRGMTETRGGLAVIEVPSPAAGANFSTVVVGAGFARILAVTFRLVTDATVATRRAFVHVFSVAAGFPTLLARSANTQTASLSRDYYFAHWGFAGFIGSSEIFDPLPPIGVVSGGSIASAVASLQGGDQISQIQVCGEMFSDG